MRNIIAKMHYRKCIISVKFDKSFLKLNKVTCNIRRTYVGSGNNLCNLCIFYDQVFDKLNVSKYCLTLTDWQNENSGFDIQDFIESLP